MTLWLQICLTVGSQTETNTWNIKICHGFGRLNVRLLLKQSGSSIQSILFFVDSSFYRLCLAKPSAIPICQEKEQILIIQRRNVGSAACGGAQAPASEFQGLFPESRPNPSWILIPARSCSRQSPKTESKVLLVGKSQGALRWLLERSDIIVSSTYMKSRQLTHARIFCLSNQGCQLSGWTTVGNEIEESREFAGFCISRTDARIPAACSKRIVTLRNKKMTASSDFSR